MREKRMYRMAHAEARTRACESVMAAPDGYVVTIEEPTRSLAQNALMWVLLTQFSKQLIWPVNGQMVKLQPEEWKDILTAAFRCEQQRISPGLNGGMVVLGMRTREFGKRAFVEFIEFMLATAADRGVVVDPEKAQRLREQAANTGAYEPQEAA